MRKGFLYIQIPRALCMIILLSLLSGCAHNTQEFTVQTAQGKAVTVCVPNHIRSDSFDMQAGQAASNAFCTRNSLSSVLDALKEQHPDYTFAVSGNDRALITDTQGGQALLKITNIGSTQAELTVHPDGMQAQGTDSDTLYKRICFYPLWAHTGANTAKDSTAAYKRFAFPIHLVAGEGDTAAEISAGHVFAQQQYMLLSDTAACMAFYTQADYSVSETDNGFILRQIPIIDLQNNRTDLQNGSTETADIEFVFTQRNGQIYAEYRLLR